MKLKDRIVRWIRKQVKDAKAKGIVMGLSGGIDSSVVAYLAKEAVGKDRLLALILPCHSQSQDLEDAKLVAKKLKIRTETLDLSNIYDELIKILPEANNIAKANLKPRLRMLTLYYFANKLNYLVCGTGNKSELMVGYFCYDKETRALTKEGLKSYMELKPGDTVFSLDLKSSEIVEKQVKKVYSFDYDGEVFIYGGRQNCRFDLIVTPNHRMLIQRNGCIEFCRADKLPRRPTPSPIPKSWSGTKHPESVFRFDNDGISVNARRFSPMAIEDFLYILGLYIGDGCAQLSSVKQFIKGSNPNSYWRDPKTGRFLYKDLSLDLKNYSSYRTWFALPKGSPFRHKLIALLKEYNIAYGETATQVWVYGKPFYKAMVSCGSLAHKKHIPSAVLNYPAKYLAILLEGLMDSDGMPRGIYYTVSKRLAEQIVELGCKLGKNVSLRKRPPRVAIRKDGVKIKSSECYEVSIYGNGRRWLNGAKFKRVHYRGKVWCPDIPGTHNLLIERNGHFLFCGNTKHGDGATDILPIGGLLKRQVRRLTKELGIPKHIITKPPTAGLWLGQTDEGEMGITYPELDDILERIESKRKQVLSKEKVNKVKEMIGRSRHKREGPRIFHI